MVWYKDPPIRYDTTQEVWNNLINSISRYGKAITYNDNFRGNISARTVTKVGYKNSPEVSGEYFVRMCRGEMNKDNSFWCDVSILATNSKIKKELEEILTFNIKSASERLAPNFNSALSETIK